MTSESPDLPCTRPATSCTPVLSSQELLRLLEFIHENLPAPITLDCLASLVRMDKFQFVRAFRATTGSTPHKYIVRTRVERAMYLLETTTSPLCVVALGCGFSSHSYFTTVFTDYVGLSPRAYRRLNADDWIARLRTPSGSNAKHHHPREH